MENPLTQEFEAASAIHLSFQKFQAMHLALRLAVAPLQGEASFHRIVIFFQSSSKALKLWDTFFSTRSSHSSRRSPFRSRSMVVNAWINS